MNKLVMSLIFVQIGLISSAQARSLYFLCDAIAQAKLPSTCKATCNKSSSGSAQLILTNAKNESASVEIGMNDRTDSETINGDIINIVAGQKGTYPSVSLSVNKDNQVLAVSVNEIECK